jgi:leucyl aminopeptidase
MDVFFVDDTIESLSKTRGVVALVLTEDCLVSKKFNKLDPRMQALVERFVSSGIKLKAKNVRELVCPNDVEAQAVYLCNVGPASEFSNLVAREIGANLANAMLRSGFGKSLDDLTIAGEFSSGVNTEFSDYVADVAFGFMLRNYAFDRYIADSKDSSKGNLTLEKLTVCCANATLAKQDFERYCAIVTGVHWARDLTNEPGNVLTTTEFVHRISELSDVGIGVEILGERQLEEIGMRALLAVGAGSEHESYVGIMKWQGGKDPESQPICLVGKGVCFDTGGVSIKPASKMEEMIADMGGAGLVAGLMKTIALLKLPLNVVGLVGLAENMPDGKAQRPGDIVKALSGTTIEVINTDAEGRMVLADVLWYAQSIYKPSMLMDFATLTGAIIIALGEENAGIFSNNEALAEKVQKASSQSGEKVWRLPLSEKYAKLNDSKVADIKNSGGRSGGSISAAEFLHKFVKDDMPWVHFDIAGMSYQTSETTYAPRGATGWGVTLFETFLRNICSEQN